MEENFSVSSTPGNASPIFRTVSKSIVLLVMGQPNSLEVTVRTCPGTAMNILRRSDYAQEWESLQDESGGRTRAFEYGY
jgi:hypothetical protein